MSRSAGVLVLTAALGVVAVTALRPDGLNGAAAPIFVPPPPAVGDCITTSVPAFPDYAPGRSVYDTYPRVPLAACDGDRYGEVVAVITAPAQPTVTGDESYMNPDDPNTGTCWQATSDYLGMTTPITVSGIDWAPSMLMQFQAIAAPSDLQQAAGQRWVACLATPYAYTTPRYSGTLRDAVQTGTARDQTGTCFDGTDGDSGSTPGACQRPHTTQLVAQASTPLPGITRDQIDQGCRTVLAQLTGIPDITGGGDLTVLTVIRDGQGNVVDRDPLLANDYLGCGLTSTDPTRPAPSAEASSASAINPSPGPDRALLSHRPNLTKARRCRRRGGSQSSLQHALSGELSGRVHPARQARSAASELQSYGVVHRPPPTEADQRVSSIASTGVDCRCHRRDVRQRFRHCGKLSEF